MDTKTQEQMREAQIQLRAKHPNWPQEKVRWIALRMVS